MRVTTCTSRSSPLLLGRAGPVERDLRPAPAVEQPQTFLQNVRSGAHRLGDGLELGRVPELHLPGAVDPTQHRLRGMVRQLIQRGAELLHLPHPGHDQLRFAVEVQVEIGPAATFLAICTIEVCA